MATEFADKIFYGGEILTMAEKPQTAEALAVRGENITAVGTVEDVFQFAGPDTTFIHLQNKTLMPGFIEPHTHAIFAAKFRSYVGISGYNYSAYSDVKARMKKEINQVDLEAQPPEWCVFAGWDYELIPDLPALDADFLDKEFSKQVPIFVIAQNLHAGWLNHKGLEVVGLDASVQDTSGAAYERKQSGELTGKVIEPGARVRVENAVTKPSPEKLLDIVKSQWNEYATRGFTTVTDLIYSPDPTLDDVIFKYCKGDTPLRLGLYSYLEGKHQIGLSGPKIDPCGTLWNAGIKIVADGSPHCGTAATKDPYLENDVTKSLGFPPAPNCGDLLYEYQDLYDMVRFYHDKGRQIAIHAHGERAIDQVLNVYDKVLSESNSTNSNRHRIEHLGFATEQQIARAAKLNITLSFFVDHLHFYGKSYAQSILGPERTNRWAPLSLATKHGVTWTIHQDTPAFPGPPRPFGNMKTAITRTMRGDDVTVYGEEYRVTIDEVLKAYTINAAWQIHRDKELGSLTVNKKADLVILSDNPHRVEPHSLENIRVLDTFIGGHSNRLSSTSSTVLDGRAVIVYGE